MINDLIGLSYERRARFCEGNNKTDCFMLVCEARRRLGLHDYEEDFQWAYDQYDAGNLPMKRIIRWLLSNGEVTNKYEDGNVVIMKTLGQELAVGVVYDGGVLTISKGGQSFWAPLPLVLSPKLFKMLPDKTK